MRALKAVALSCLIVATMGSTTLYKASHPMAGWTLRPHAKVNREEVIRMNVGLRRRNMEEAESLFWRVSDPRSHEYGDHLDNKGAVALMSPGAEAIRTVMTWLEAHGVRNARLARHEDYIFFDAPVAVVEALLKTPFEVYYNKAENREVSRALGQIDIPEEIAPFVEVIGGHRGFPLPKVRKAKVPVTTAIPATGAPTIKPTQAPTIPPTPTPTQAPTWMNVTPEVIFKAYNVSYHTQPPADTYNLQSFFQAQSQFVDPEDMIMFCNSYLPAQFKNCSISKYIGPNVGSEAGLESSLDSEYIFSMGWGTETWGWSYTSNDFCGDLMNWAHDVFDRDADKHPYVISMSYGSQMLPNFCVGPDVDRLSKDIMKMGLLGISVMIASGDMGSGEYSREGYNEGLLGTSMPAEIPYCTSVGATTFVLNQNSGDEMATNGFGSGGGFSFYYPTPSYQLEAVANFIKTSTKLPPALSYNSSGRGTPDVSALGWNFTVVSQGIYQGVGGTSASTPTFSGLVSQLNNIRLENKKTLGFLNPLLYQHPEAMNDVIYGNNDVNGDGYGWYATKGWDPASGLGTPNFGRLAELVRSINSAERARGGQRAKQA